MPPQTMQAVVCTASGPPSVLQLQTLPIPVPQKGECLIRIKAFGLNRSEIFTRRGDTPPSIVQFPRVLGIEAVGLVESCPGNEFTPGDLVLTAMGGLGRAFDGSYAEYTCPPAAQVLRLPLPTTTSLPWATLGALPEMIQTAHGSLFAALKLQHGDRLLIRGGTTSVGLAAAGLARNAGAEVWATTRSPTRTQLLRDAGVQRVILDEGPLAPTLQDAGGGADKVLELIGASTLPDSLRCAKPGGTVCMTGMVGNAWSLADFAPMEVVPSTVNLTTYAGGNEDVLGVDWAGVLRGVVDGVVRVPVGMVVRGLEGVRGAHEAMEEGRAGGKVVVVVGEEE